MRTSQVTPSRPRHAGRCRVREETARHGSSYRSGMPSTQSARLLTLALVVFVSLSPALARADGPRVVVLPFEGAEAVSTRLVVYEALEAEGVELTSLAAAGEAARAARVRGLSRRRVGRVLAIADADAALQGRTTVARDRVLVRLVLSTASGRVL